ncbi:hypothetical protein [Endozoicomonas sp. GU-1]|uniref:hypothetical protein n=1 Tax=Endozoicomonas sp. GU-1 TaxID=3009078 RepID=UPI0022B35D70|nr:hypothetical protein [Endozoicomonas sp. GU-1]WBA83319.1 hypothetical protein O2T12_09445 [Endozoicomonas sp. GU-1]
MIQRSGETSLIQSLPTPLSNGPVDRSGDVPPTDQPQASWKRWAVCIFPAASTLVSAAFTLSAISSGCFVAAAVFGVLTVMSADCAVNACSPHNTLSTNPSTFSRGIDRLSHLLSCLSESTSNIVYNQGYEVVDVPGDGNCFFHAALVSSVQRPGRDAHSLRQQVYEEAREWLQNYQNNHSRFNEDESCRPSVPEEDLYFYLTNDSDHDGMTGMDAIKCDGKWMYTVIAPLVARVLQKPVITVNNKGTIMSAVDAYGFYFPVTDDQLKNFDLNGIGDFVLLENTDNNHFRGCRKRNIMPEAQYRRVSEDTIPEPPAGQIASHEPLFAKKTLKHIVGNPSPDLA